MKAIRVNEFGAPEVMHLEDVPEPKPGAGEVCVSVRAAGVNPFDTYIRAGTYAIKPSLPYTPGADAAGIVKATGDGVTKVAVGARVYAQGTLSGAYAEAALCQESQVWPLPERVSFAQGAAVGVPYATAHRALFHRAHAAPGETVLVHGASGGVGVAATQLARAAGLTVMGTAGTEDGLKLVKEQGAHYALDHRQAGYLDGLMSLTAGKGVDVILEMLANVNLDKDLNVLAKFGRLVVIGSRGTVEITPRSAMVRDADILGMTLFNATEQDLKGIHAALVAGLEDGALKPFVGQEIPLADAARAHHAVMESGARGKIVLVP
jgi:NADPH2:quinone reductase